MRVPCLVLEHMSGQRMSSRHEDLQVYGITLISYVNAARHQTVLHEPCLDPSLAQMQLSSASLSGR